MYVSLDHEQTQVLREMLENALRQMRIESSRTDAHDYREMLHRREEILESLIAKFSEEARVGV